jgi:hypothetical protein
MELKEEEGGMQHYNISIKEERTGKDSSCCGKGKKKKKEEKIRDLSAICL